MKPYDREVIDELRELLEDEFTLLLQAYVDDVRFKVAEMQALKSSQDWQGIRHLAHSLKGSSINLGIEQFSLQCSEIEAHAKSGDTDKLAASMSTLKENSHTLCEALTADFLS